MIESHCGQDLTSLIGLRLTETLNSGVRMLAFVSFAAVLATCASEMTAPGIDRHVSDGVKSLGYRVVYGDEDMTIINEVVQDMEKTDIIKKQNGFKEAIPVLPVEDVKCLMSVEKHCSKEMAHMKSKFT